MQNHEIVGKYDGVSPVSNCEYAALISSASHVPISFKQTYHPVTASIRPMMLYVIVNLSHLKGDRLNCIESDLEGH